MCYGSGFMQGYLQVSKAFICLHNSYVTKDLPVKKYVYKHVSSNCTSCLSVRPVELFNENYLLFSNITFAYPAASITNFLTVV